MVLTQDQIGQIICVTAGHYDDYEILGHYRVLSAGDGSGFREPSAMLDALVTAGILEKLPVAEVNIPL